MTRKTAQNKPVVAEKRKSTGVYKRVLPAGKVDDFYSYVFTINGTKYYGRTETTDLQTAILERANAIIRKRAELEDKFDPTLGQTTFRDFAINVFLPAKMKEDVKETLLEYEFDIIYKVSQLPGVTSEELENYKVQIKGPDFHVLVKTEIQNMAKYLVDTEIFKKQLPFVVKSKLIQMVIWFIRIRKKTSKNMIDVFRLVDPVFGNKSLEDFTPVHLNNYRDLLTNGTSDVITVKQDAVSTATRNKRLNLIRSSFRMAKEKGYVKSELFYALREAKNEGENNSMIVRTSKAERAAIIDASADNCEQIYEMLTFSDLTGITDYRLFNLRWETIFLNRSEPYMTAKGNPGTKNKVIYLCPEVVKILERREKLRNEARHVFFKNNGVLFSWKDIGFETLQMRDIVQYGMYSGLRGINLLRLRWDALFLGVETPHMKIRITKNGDSLEVPLLPQAIEAVRNRLRSKTDDYPFVFKNPRTGLPYVKVEKRLKAIMETVERTDIKFHGLRHIFCTMMAEAGAGLHDIMTFGGFRKEIVAQRYINRDMKALSKVVSHLE